MTKQSSIGSCAAPENKIPGESFNALPQLLSKKLVRVEGVEPSSQAWEAHIIAVIRHPRREKTRANQTGGAVACN